MQEMSNSPYQDLKKDLIGRFTGAMNTKINRSAKHFSRVFKNNSIHNRVHNISKTEDKLDLLLALIEREISVTTSIANQKSIQEDNSKFMSDHREVMSSKYKTYISLMDGNPAVTMETASDYLHCSPGMIKSLVKDGLLKEIHIRKRVYYSKKDLVQLYSTFFEK
jgi:hypothetical protein